MDFFKNGKVHCQNTLFVKQKICMRKSHTDFSGRMGEYENVCILYLETLSNLINQQVEEIMTTNQDIFQNSIVFQ